VNEPIKVPQLIPDGRWWVRIVRAGYCPACGMPFPQSFTTDATYPSHYLFAHLRPELIRRLS
jgi:hypothetical protein